MQASQPRRAFTEDSWQKASSSWTHHSVSPGLLTLPGRSWLLAVQHWESQRENGTFWAEGRRTSQSPAFGSNAQSSRNFSFSSCQSSVVTTTSESVLGVGESLQELESVLEKRGVDREVIKKQLTRLDKTASPGPAPPQALVAQPLQSQVEALEQLGPVQEEEIDVVVRRQPGRQACAKVKEPRAQELKELPDGFNVCEAVQSKTLSQVGILLDGSRSRLLLCTRTKDHSNLGNTSKRKCASVAAQPCSHQCHKTVAQIRIRLRYGCFLVYVVQSSVQPLQLPPPPFFLLSALFSTFRL